MSAIRQNEGSDKNKAIWVNWGTVRPNVVIKSIPNVYKSLPKNGQSSFYLKSDIFKLALKAPNLLKENLWPRTLKNGPIWTHFWKTAFEAEIRQNVSKWRRLYTYTRPQRSHKANGRNFSPVVCICSDGATKGYIK